MLNDPWLQSIPDSLTEEVLDEVEDPLERAELQDLHAKLRRAVGMNQRRQQDLQAKHGIVRSNRNDLLVRFNLLLEMFIGATSVERLRYELKYAEALAEAMEIGYSDFLKDKRAPLLHIPGKGQIFMTSKEEKPDGTD